MMLSLYKLEIFNTVTEAGSFSAAADRLLLTQPAVSQHIQELEASLGARLFRRGRRGVRLTPAGEALLDYTRRILTLVREAENAVSNVDQLRGGQMRIGATPSFGSYILPDWIQGFQSRFANITASLFTGITPEIMTRILNHTLDIGFVEGEWIEDWRINKVVLSEINHCVAVKHDHPWAGQTTIRLEQLQGQPFITRPAGSQTRIWLDQILKQHHLSLNIIAEFDSPEAIKQAVIAGMGVAVLPDYVTQQEQQSGIIHALPVEDADLQRTLKLIWERQEPFKPLTRTFLTHLAGRFPQLMQLTAQT